ncbi:hypothetical protein [Microbacterium timonense]|uniref:hypothetical protein n=1 Tax=Microbacterium timonense TaxID=2086576 RepID=UPI000D114A64|nr:hypothetical protein [Microbacterium timonense]
MTFEPTFDDLEKKSSELPDVSGDVGDVAPDDIDRDLAGDADTAGDEEAIAEGASIAASSEDVDEDDLPPYGEE